MRMRAVTNLPYISALGPQLVRRPRHLALACHSALYRYTLFRDRYSVQPFLVSFRLPLRSYLPSLVPVNRKPRDINSAHRRPRTRPPTMADLKPITVSRARTGSFSYLMLTSVSFLPVVLGAPAADGTRYPTRVHLSRDMYPRVGPLCVHVRIVFYLGGAVADQLSASTQS